MLWTRRLTHSSLVAAGFDVLRTSRNVSVLLAAIQVLTVGLLGLHLAVLLGLLIAVNPDLEDERRTIVTPAVKWLTLWLVDRQWLKVLIWILLVGGLVGGTGGWYFTGGFGPVENEEASTERGDGAGVAGTETELEN